MASSRRQQVPRTAAGTALHSQRLGGIDHVQLQPQSATIDPPLLFQTGPGDAEQQLQVLAWAQYAEPFYPADDPAPYETQIPHLTQAFWSTPTDQIDQIDHTDGDDTWMEPCSQALLDEMSLCGGAESTPALSSSEDTFAHMQIDHVADHLARPDNSQVLPATHSPYDQVPPINAGAPQHPPAQRYPVPKSMPPPSKERTRPESSQVRQTEHHEVGYVSEAPKLVRIPPRARAALKAAGHQCAEEEDPAKAYQLAIYLQRMLDPLDDSHREFIDASHQSLHLRLQEAKRCSNRKAEILLTLLTKTKQAIIIRLGKERLQSIVEEWPRWDTKDPTSLQFLALQKGFRYSVAFTFDQIEAFIQGGELMLDPRLVITRQKVRFITETISS